MNENDLPEVRFPSHLMANAMRRELEALNNFMLGRESIEITHRYFEAVYRYYGERVEKLEIALAEAQKEK